MTKLEFDIFIQRIAILLKQNAHNMHTDDIADALVDINNIKITENERKRKTSSKKDIH